MDIISIDLREIQNGRQLKKIFRDNGYEFYLKPQLVFNEYKNKGRVILLLDKESLFIVGYFTENMTFEFDESFQQLAKSATTKKLKFKQVTQKKEKMIDLNKSSLSDVLNKIETTGADSIPFKTLTKKRTEEFTNEILEKISKFGLDSLSGSEKSFLDNLTK